MSNLNSSRTLYIHNLKSNDENEIKDIISKVNNYFNDSDDYFSVEKISVGKFHNIENISKSLNENIKNSKTGKKKDQNRTLSKLNDGDTVLISEACTHHRQCNDIGTVKFPKWIKN